MAKGLFEMMKPKLVEMATTAIDSYIESTGEVDSEGESDEKKLDLSVLEPGGIVKTTREGKIVLAGYKSKAKDLTKAVSNALPQLKGIKKIGFGKYKMA